MSKLALWITWAVVGAIYQGAKPLVGLHPNWASHFDAMYWTGFTLLFVWWSDRRMQRR